MRMRLLLLLILTFPLSAWAQDASPGPYQTVKTATNKLLKQLVEVKPLYKSDPEKFYAEIKASLGPFIDFDGFAKGVMARYYRRASPKQRAEFADKFQNELIHTYSNALVKFNNQKVEVLPMDEPPQDGRATVELKVYGSDGTIYPVKYSLSMVDGSWKLRNVVINGINIGLQFRGQFQNYMEQYHGNIDKVIANWDVHAANH